MIDNIPLPATDDPIDSEYWKGTLKSKLLLQCCRHCGRKRFPPRPMCPDCQHADHTWEEVSGRGRIWSFTAPQSPLLPAFEALKPYVTALVQLEEDPSLRIVGPVLYEPRGNIQGVEASRVYIGQKVSVTFKDYSEDVAMPCWVLQSDN